MYHSLGLDHLEDLSSEVVQYICVTKISAAARVRATDPDNKLSGSPACLQSRDTTPDTFPPVAGWHAIIFVHLSLPCSQKREEIILY